MSNTGTKFSDLLSDESFNSLRNTLTKINKNNAPKKLIPEKEIPPPRWKPWGNPQEPIEWDYPLDEYIDFGNPPEIDPEQHDVNFQLLDTLISFSSDETILGYYDIKQTWDKPISVFLTGRTVNGHRVVVEYTDYKPWIYVTLEQEPPKCSREWVERFIIEPLLQRNDKLDRANLSFELVKKKLYSGFTDESYSTVALFQFRTWNTYKTFRNGFNHLFPPPTEDEIKRGIYRNEIMMVDAFSNEEIKFLNWLGLTSGGGILLKKGTYTKIKSFSNVRTDYYFKTKHLEESKTNFLGKFVFDIFDIETIRHDEKHELSNPKNPLDAMACICHLLVPSDGSRAPRYIVFTWGDLDVHLPPIDRKGRKFDPMDIRIYRYKNERQMMANWAIWWSTVCDSDVRPGHNITGFDIQQLMDRLSTIPNLPKSVFVWGRMNKLITKLDTTSIETKAIAYRESYTAESFGRVFVDILPWYERDTSLHLNGTKDGYSLKGLSKHFFGTTKEDVHYSEIKYLFYGNLTQFESDAIQLTPEQQRGLLIIYNAYDCLLTYNLFKPMWLSVVNLCTETNILPKMILKGMTFRYYSSIQKLAMQDDWVLYRPHYHPILDSKIFDQENESEESDSSNSKYGDLMNVVKHFSKYYDENESNFSVSSFACDDNGKKQEEQPTTPHAQFFNKIGASENVYDKPVVEKYTGPIARKYRSEKDKLTINGKSLNAVMKNINKKTKKTYLAGPNAGKNMKTKGEKKHAGGNVFDPDRHLHRDVLTQDFQSLYPSIIGSYLMDICNLVLDPKYANLPNVTYNDFRLSSKTMFRFAYSKNGKPYHGLIIKQIFRLLNGRKSTKQELGRVDQIKQMSVFLAIIINENRGIFKVWKDIFSSFENETTDMLESIYYKFYSFLCAMIYHFIDLKNYDSVPSVQFFTNMVNKVFDPKGKYWNKAKEEDIAHCSKNCKEIIDIIIEKPNECCSELLQWFKKNFRDARFLSFLQWFFIAWLSKERLVDDTTLQNMWGDDDIELRDKYMQFYTEVKVNRSNLDSRQLTQKICANSIFGAQSYGGFTFDPETGRLKREGKLTCVPIGACITFMGRRCIKISQSYVEQKMGLRVIYGDTDSLMISTEGMEGKPEDPVERRAFLFDLGDKISNGINSNFHGIMKIVSEKVNTLFKSLDAKLYIAYTFLSPTAEGKIDQKGVSWKKSNFCEFTSKLGEEINEVLFKEEDVEKAIAMTKEKLWDLVKNPDKYYEQLVITEKLGRRDYANSPAHLILNNKVGERDPARKVKVGGHVRYLYVTATLEKDENGNWTKIVPVIDFQNRKKKHFKIEEYYDVVQHKLPVDILWYLENQIKNTIDDLFLYFIESPKIREIYSDVAAYQGRIQKKIDKSIFDGEDSNKPSSGPSIFDIPDWESIKQPKKQGREYIKYEQLPEAKKPSVFDCPTSKRSTDILFPDPVKKQKIEDFFEFGRITNNKRKSEEEENEIFFPDPTKKQKIEDDENKLKRYEDRKKRDAGVYVDGRNSLLKRFYTAGVVLGKNFNPTTIALVKLEDYEKMNEKELAYATSWIKKNVESHYVCFEEIEESTIDEAVNVSIKKCLEQLRPDVILCNETKLQSSIRVLDGKGYYSFVCAMILAKYYRIQYIKSLIKQNPDLEAYKLDQNYGNSSKDHWETIRKKGPSKFHRKIKT